MKLLSISLSPNTEKDDIILALKLLFSPWKWKKGTKELEDNFKKYLGVKYAFSFNSGRAAFFSIIKALEIKEPILLQSFTCNAVVNPILWAGLVPEYIDCNEEDFNINIEALNKKTDKGFLMIQHTFGMPQDLDRISDNFTVIEDCAHALGAEYKGKKVGTIKRASFFSFSRDKVISCVYGGMAVTNDDELARQIARIQEDIKYPSYFWIFQQLLHPLLMNLIIIPLYNTLGFGKFFLILSQSFHILSKAVSLKEKKGEKPEYFPKKLPNALAILANNQLLKLERYNEHREKIANVYYRLLANTSLELPKRFNDRKNVFLRFTIKHKKAHDIILHFWHKKKILIGDWYTTPVAPFDTKLKEMKYELGICPIAEKMANITFNLPTHINVSEKQAEEIAKILLDYLK